MAAFVSSQTCSATFRCVRLTSFTYTKLATTKLCQRSNHGGNDYDAKGDVALNTTFSGEPKISILHVSRGSSTMSRRQILDVQCK